jgi:subtilisin family serine protease
MMITIASMLLVSLPTGTYSQNYVSSIDHFQSQLQFQSQVPGSSPIVPRTNSERNPVQPDTNTDITGPKPIKIITNSLLLKIKAPLGNAKFLEGDEKTSFDKTVENITALVNSKGGKAVSILKNFGILHVKLGDPNAGPSVFEPTSKNVKALATTTTNPMLDKFKYTYTFKKSLEASPYVEAVYYDALVPLATQILPTGIDRIDADRSPAISGDNTGRTRADIAILDTGVQVDHPDLNVVTCISFAGNPESTEEYPTEPKDPVPLNDCTDSAAHGTHVAGIAAALDNDIGVVGTAPGANIHAIKVCTRGGCEVSDIIEGLNYVASHYNEIDVVNLSLGGFVPDWFSEWLYGVGTDLKEEAIARLVNTYQVVVVIAAGNDNINAINITPARVREAITVSSILDYNGRCGSDPNRKWDDSFSMFSNYGSIIDIAAPGGWIESTIPTNLGSHSGYGSTSGTSMAAPHVAGAAALYLSLHPSASPAEVEDYLKSTATNAPKPLQETTMFSCDKNGKGYFSTSYDKDDIREPLLYMGWNAPDCPPDCPVAEDVDNIPNNDRDNDGIVDSQDNCPDTYNSNQKNLDSDNMGDACDPDDDNDGDPDGNDNCKTTYNPNQIDWDDDGKGDACDPDDDNDGRADAVDNCRLHYNPDQRDSDHDRRGDACDFDEDVDRE